MVSQIIKSIIFESNSFYTSVLILVITMNFTEVWYHLFNLLWVNQIVINSWRVFQTSYYWLYPLMTERQPSGSLLIIPVDIVCVRSKNKLKNIKYFQKPRIIEICLEYFTEWLSPHPSLCICLFIFSNVCYICVNNFQVTENYLAH